MKIGFIGLGAMGRGTSLRLLNAGYALVVHDIRRTSASRHLESGALWADTPRELAEVCDVVFTSLPTPAAVETVCDGDDGLAAGLRQGATWFDLTTNSVGLVRRLNARLAAQGIAFLDAPVSGRPEGAASGKLAVWVGGDKAAFDRCKPILDAMADQARYIGESGAGAIVKLVHNIASSAISGVLAEAFTMGTKAGIDPLALWEAVRQGASGRQGAFEKVGTRILPGQFDPPSFALRLVDKDVQLGLELARDVGVPMPMCDMVGKEIQRALDRGWGERDALVFTLLQQERAGISPFAVPREQIQAVLAQD